MTMQIATRFGFHRTTVAKHLKQAGEMLQGVGKVGLGGVLGE